jgi:hypothetical protein
MKTPFQISKLDYWVYGISLGLCFLLFKQSDLTLTNNASFAYLYGHFGDFYDYNKPLFTGNNYLPVFYWIFALWNIPLKLLGLAPEITTQTWMLSTQIQTIWSKLLLAIFFFASVRCIGQISDQIKEYSPLERKDHSGIMPKYLFATSPIGIFAVFIFSGYDIFGVYFTLLGLQAYLAKDFKKFAFWFSIAISFKYFAAFIYLPLVLIVEKRLAYLVFYGLFGIAFSGIQFWMYWHSEAFHLGIFGMIGEKTGGHGISLRFIVANVIYVMLCSYMYFSKFRLSTNPYAWCQRAVFVCVLAYALLFSWTLWHPQWLVVITPFICLSFLFIRSQRVLLSIEILGYLGFIIFCINNWVGNVDNSMLYEGVFGGLLPKTSILASDLIGSQWMPISRVLLYGSLYAPLLIQVIEGFLSKRRRNFTGINTKDRASVMSELNKERLLFNLRFFLATYFFISISALCLTL